MNNNTPGLSALADAVNALNDGVDSLGSRMDAMTEGKSKTAAELNRERDYNKAKSSPQSGAARKAEHEKNFGSKHYSKADASKEVHEFYATHAKKTAQKAIDGGDPKMAAKWVDYGAGHSKEAEAKKAKEDKLEAPPEDKKKGDAVRKDASNEEHFREAALQQARAYEKQGRHEQAKKSREEAAKWAEKAKNPAPVSRLSDLGPFKK
jgi:hypothetical protein